MQPVTAEFLAALRSNHAIASQATLLPADGSAPFLLPLLAAGGSVVLDRTADVRGTCSLQVAPSRSDAGNVGVALWPATPTDPLNVYGSEVVIQRGVRYGGGSQEMVQLGRFRVDELQRDLPGGAITITGVDRSQQVIDTRFTKPRKFTSQTVLALVTLLVREVWPAAAINDLSGGDAVATTIPQHAVALDRWAEVQRVCKLIGCEGFFDATGDFVIQPVASPLSAVSVYDVDAGPTGVLVTAQNIITRRGAPNVIVARGEDTASGQAPVQSASPHGYDLGANSPTRVGGPYGTVPLFYASGHLRTTAQANKLADAMLADHLGASKTVTFNAVPNPALEPGDGLTVRYPDGVSELHVIDSVSQPLDAATAMSAETRAADWGGT